MLHQCFQFAISIKKIILKVHLLNNSIDIFSCMVRKDNIKVCIIMEKEVYYQLELFCQFQLIFFL